ncbi:MULTISPECIES: LytR/AlgR family response regulator transcription factor [Niastella]|uniref:Response regulator transcription factor n=1 Tax=Niastella soli TaxID=2821487 RepID=A0ABS3YP08_9BACT|nr:LytTR family DNA-binding domain-containing protein [Niastella soli]MBO9199612.1 response regulator transcription factor [Niastella soli]
MQLKCIAIDDEPLALELLQEYISRFPQLKLVHTFDDAISAVELLRNTRVDLLFIDINMPDITGIDLVRSLHEKPIVIFTTAHKQFAIEGFELDAVDYLLKPINFDRFTRAVNKAIDYFKYKSTPAQEENDSLFVHSEYKLVKIPLNEIEYIESLEDYIKIHITGTKPVLTLLSMKKVLEKLPADKFQRIHRSYIVAVSRVKSIQNRKVQLSTGVELPISDSYVQFINNWKKS